MLIYQRVLQYYIRGFFPCHHVTMSPCPFRPRTWSPGPKRKRLPKAKRCAFTMGGNDGNIHPVQPAAGCYHWKFPLPFWISGFTKNMLSRYIKILVLLKLCWVMRFFSHWGDTVQSTGDYHHPVVKFCS